MSQFDLELASIVPIGGDVFVLDLVASDGGELPPFEAGAHIDLHIRPQMIRPYSLCNDPAESRRYRLGVLLDANSRGGSQIICSQWAAGMQIRVSAPRNLFPLAATEGMSHLVAGGIGVTPLISMAHSLHASGSAFGLHYCARDADRAPFLAELTAGHLQPYVRPHFSENRRFDVERDIGPPGADDHLYVCGPQGFMTHVIEAAQAAGWDDQQIHYELFDAETDTSGGPFRIEVADGTMFDIPAGKSMADILIDAGYDVEISCEKGICGSCITDVLEGDPDHRDHYLTAEEKAENGCVALCCSRSFTPILKLDLQR